MYFCAKLHEKKEMADAMAKKKNVQYQKSLFKQLFFEITIAKSKYLVLCCLYYMIPSGK